MKIIQLATSKPWIGVDLDGTLAEYNEWKGVEHIGKPISKMVQRVKRWISEGKTVKIFTARASGDDKDIAIPFIKEWCKEHIGETLDVVCEKDQDMTELWDDRAVRVKKNEGTRIAQSKDKFDESRDKLGADLVDDLLAEFGMGPKYIPKKPKSAGKCPKCNSENTIFKEVHPDTDMNDIVLKCNDCGFIDD
jgi:hypothetical protein